MPLGWFGPTTYLVSLFLVGNSCYKFVCVSKFCNMYICITLRQGQNCLLIHVLFILGDLESFTMCGISLLLEALLRTLDLYIPSVVSLLELVLLTFTQYLFVLISINESI